MDPEDDEPMFPFYKDPKSLGLNLNPFEMNAYLKEEKKKLEELKAYMKIQLELKNAQLELKKLEQKQFIMNTKPETENIAASKGQPVDILETNLFGDSVLVIRDTIAEQTDKSGSQPLYKIADNISLALSNSLGGSWVCTAGVKDSFDYKQPDETATSLTATMGVLKFVIFKEEIASKPSVP